MNALGHRRAKRNFALGQSVGLQSRNRCGGYGGCLAGTLNSPGNTPLPAVRSYPAIAASLQLINVSTTSSYRAEAVAHWLPDLQQVTDSILRPPMSFQRS